METMAQSPWIQSDRQLHASTTGSCEWSLGKCLIMVSCTLLSQTLFALLNNVAIWANMEAPTSVEGVGPESAQVLSGHTVSVNLHI